MRFITAVIIAITTLVAPATAMAGNDSKVYICHAAGQEGTTHFNTLHISENAVYGRNGNAGHFEENGTPRAGHEQDYFGQCQTPSTTTEPTSTTPPTEPPVTTEPPTTTQPPVTEPPEPPTLVPTTTVPPVVTDPPKIVDDYDCPADGFPRIESNDCLPDLCLFNDHSGYTFDYSMGRGDANDKSGTTQWYVMECHVPVPNDGPAPTTTVGTTLPVTGSGNNIVIALLALATIGAGALAIRLARRANWNLDEDEDDTV